MEIWSIVLCATAALFAFFVFAYDQNKRIICSRYTITKEAVPSPLRLVHLSDLHSGIFKNLYQKVAGLKPNLIMITGDLVNDKGRRIPEMLELVRLLCTICPVYYVTGNHERRLPYFEKLMQQIADAGAIVLLDELAQMQMQQTQVTILGLDEKQGSFADYKQMAKGDFQYRDSSHLFRRLENEPGLRVAMTHFPENYACIGSASYQNYDFDLMLAGHAHGGQFNLPLVGPVFSPGQGLFPKYAGGSFGTRPMLVVSRGLGNSEFPLRLFNHPEIVVIDIVKKEAGTK